MPGLGASTSSTGRHGKGRNVRRRVRIIASIVGETFTGSVGGFSASSGNIVVGADPTGTQLSCATGVAGAGEYAYKEYTCEPNVALDYSIECTGNSLGTCKILLGTSAGDNTYTTVTISGTGTSTGTFTPTGSSYFLSFQLPLARRTWKFDNISITEA